MVDDHIQVRRLVSRLLADVPLAAIEAGTVASALEILASPQPVSLLLCDLELPDGTGVELIQRALRLRPSLPALLVSGYDVTGAGYDFILKPFEPELLLRKIRSLLGE